MRAASLVITAALVGCQQGPRVHELGAAHGALRPDNPASQDLLRFQPGDVVEQHDGASIRVHYTRAGVNAVPLADGDTSGTPDFVEAVAAIYEQALDAFVGGLGMRPPLSDELSADNGGDDRFDVYLLDFAGNADGAFRVDPDGCTASPMVCVGYMVQENDFAGYAYPSANEAIAVVASHELFHAVQAAYDVGQGSVLREGSAVWATEYFDTDLDDLERLSGGYLQQTDRPLDRPPGGPIDPFSYGAAVFFQFLSERFEPGIIRALWERCEDGAGGVDDPQWLGALAELLPEAYASTFAEAMVDFARWNLFVGPWADPEQGYARGDELPEVGATEVSLPHRQSAMRVYHASLHVFTAASGGRAEIAAALVGSDDELADLSLVLAARTPTEVLGVAAGRATEGPLDLAAQADAEVVAVVVHTGVGGSSRRPTLCLGDPDEVEACRSTGGTPSEPTAPDDPQVPGGGCAGLLGGPGPWAGLVVGLLARRRVRSRPLDGSRRVP